MAAPDFPASPTVGQTYTAPSGLVYTWDGTVWTTTAGAASTYWTDTGTALTPTDATKRVSIPGPTASGADQSSLVLGSRTMKTRLGGLPTVDGTWWHVNRYFDGTQWQRDDVTRDAWTVTLQPGQPQPVQVVYVPTSGGVGTAVLSLDNAGKLTLSGATIFMSTKMQLTQSSADNSDFSHNWGGTASIGWIWRLDGSGGDQVLAAHRDVAGTITFPFTFQGNGNLLILGSVGQKASGTTWSNPSDIRLKKDIRPYERGLTDILRLEPIHYTLKAGDIETCGFDAEKVRDVFPECISTTKMRLDPADEEETENVLVFDMHPILVALVNAVKELAAKVNAATAEPSHA